VVSRSASLNLIPASDRVGRTLLIMRIGSASWPAHLRGPTLTRDNRTKGPYRFHAECAREPPAPEHKADSPRCVSLTLIARERPVRPACRATGTRSRPCAPLLLSPGCGRLRRRLKTLAVDDERASPLTLTTRSLGTRTRRPRVRDRRSCRSCVRGQAAATVDTSCPPWTRGASACASTSTSRRCAASTSSPATPSAGWTSCAPRARRSAEGSVLRRQVGGAPPWAWLGTASMLSTCSLERWS
jgi:hypothetical protein